MVVTGVGTIDPVSHWVNCLPSPVSELRLAPPNIALYLQSENDSTFFTYRSIYIAFISIFTSPISLYYIYVSGLPSRSRNVLYNAAMFCVGYGCSIYLAISLWTQVHVFTQLCTHFSFFINCNVCYIYSVGHVIFVVQRYIATQHSIMEHGVGGYSYLNQERMAL